MLAIAGAHDNVLEPAAIVMTEAFAKWRCYRAAYIDLPVGGISLEDHGNPVIVAVIFIKGQFIPNPEAYQQGHGHTQGQAQDIDEGIDPVLTQIAAGDLEIASQHGGLFLKLSKK